MSAKRQKRYRLRKQLTALYTNSIAHKIITADSREHKAVLEIIDILSNTDDTDAIRVLIDTMIGFSTAAYIYREGLHK